MGYITASEVAGLGVGTLLLCATMAAPKVDAFISSSQRSYLGMCKRCGDLRLIACSTCKGTGLVRPAGRLGFGLFNDLYHSIGGANSNVKAITCTKCRSKGSFRCPDCSKTSAV